MKKAICLALAMIVLFVFAACGANSTVKVPDEDLIREDLQKSLSEHQSMQGACALEVQDHQIIKSLTEDKSYSTEVEVTAESKYAQFHYTANVTYTLYDQGWSMDSCEWTYVDYEVIRYPDEKSLEDLNNQEEVDAMVNPEFTGNADYLQVHSLIITDWSPYATGSTDRITKWTYNSYSDRWDYIDTAIHHGQVRPTDACVEALIKTLNIHDFAETGFDLEADNQYFQVDTIHVELKVDQSVLNEDKIILHFQSSFDQVFYNKDKECEGEGYMMVRMEIFREPQQTVNPAFPDYDATIWLTMVDDTWVNPLIYSIPTYVAVSGEVFR